MVTLVLTVLGADRPGLVDAVAAAVERHGANWERSQMVRLGGRFAGIVEVRVPAHQAADLRAAMASFADDHGLEVLLDDAGDEPEARGRRVTLSLVGADRPGLVRAVTAALVEIGANIESLTSSTESAPMDGTPLFRADAVVVLPAGADEGRLRSSLEALAGRLMVDVDLVEGDEAPA